MVLPLGAGQRELIIGERKTGKTWFALQTLANQVKQGKAGIYCAVGKQAREILAVKEWLTQHGVMEKIIIVATGAGENQAEVVLAPFTAMSLAEYMRDKGNDVCVVLDDLTTHAKYYREMSLLMGKFPGRDSYPGDVFYLQSRLLERAGCFDIEGQKRSISCLPIAERVGGDLTGYIQSNLMSITDGHIYFDADLFQYGARPAVNVFLSVTRVGRQTRRKLYHAVSAEIYSVMKNVEVAKTYARFGPERTEAIKKSLARGDNMDKLLTQRDGRPYEEWEMFYLYAWYRREEAITDQPEELLARLVKSGKVEEWKKFIQKAETPDELTSFVEKREA